VPTLPAITPADPSIMKMEFAPSQGLNEIRQFVQRAICEQNDLEAAAAPMTEQRLVRGGKYCGMLFCVKGPRSVTFTAIWDPANNAVVFYDSAGKSRQRTKLTSMSKMSCS